MLKYSIGVIFLFVISVFFLDAYNAVAKQKKIRDSHQKRIILHNNVYAPRGYKVGPVQKRSFDDNNLMVRLYARRFARGEAMLLEIYPKKNVSLKTVNILKILFNHKKILYSKKKYGYRALIAIAPILRAGWKKLNINYQINHRPHNFHFSTKIEKASFKYYPHPMDLGKYSDVDYRLKTEEIAFIKKCSQAKRRVFKIVSRDMMGRFRSYPRNYHYITSPFWAKRVIMRYRKRGKRKIRFKSKINIHRGLDLRGRQGEPVYALESGKVVLAQKMYYEGNFLVLDHGRGIFSYYMHLDRFCVHVGDIVNAGQKIALVGSTGLSTASHLHVSLMIQGIQVNPLSLLPLPIKN